MHHYVRHSHSVLHDLEDLFWGNALLLPCTVFLDEARDMCSLVVLLIPISAVFKLPIRHMDTAHTSLCLHIL
jgi:hypothetical protein